MINFKAQAEDILEYYRTQDMNDPDVRTNIQNEIENALESSYDWGKWDSKMQKAKAIPQFLTTFLKG